MTKPAFADPSPVQWHGWGRENLALHVGHVPSRKSACLYVVDGGVMYVMAYFRSDKEAYRALAILDAFLDPT